MQWLPESARFHVASGQPDKALATLEQVNFLRPFVFLFVLKLKLKNVPMKISLIKGRINETQFLQDMFCVF